MAVGLTIRECVFPVCGPSCRRDCPPLPPSTPSAAAIPDVTCDDLIRLVVGMQWQIAMAQHGIGWAFTAWEIAGWTPQNGAFDLRPAVDIVDEWLGVR